MNQTAVIQAIDVEAPSADQPRYGLLREAVLDAILLDRPTRVPAAVVDVLTAWACDQIAQAGGDMRGLTLAGVPDDYLPVLRWLGVPLAREGELVWGRDLLLDPDVPGPQERHGALHLPEAAALGGLTSLAVKPLRAYIARRLGLRLQIGTGVGMFLWSDRALLTSSAAVPLAGFLHGPEAGRRNNIALQPGGWQAVELI